MPENSELSYPGPTIVLDPTGSATTYADSAEYPSPVPILLKATLTTDVINPGTTASYTLKFQSTSSTI